MKPITRPLFLFLVVLSFSFASCENGGEEQKPEAQVQLERLSSTWTLVEASDGTNRTADFPNLKLTVSGTYAENGTYNYSFTGTRPNPSPWPQSGTWRFGQPVVSQVIRDPGSSEIQMNYTLTNNGNGLTITFVVPSGSAGWQGGTSRTKSVTGNWTFEFQK